MQTQLTRDGSHTVYSTRFEATYHSRFGAVRESELVFIEAGLLHRAAELREIDVLETGFGTGLNALMTWAEAEKHRFNVRYTALELYPLPLDLIETLNYPQILAGKYPEADLAGMSRHLHQCAWDASHELAPFFTLNNRKTAIEAFAASGAYDVIYFDAFAPDTQPELWTEAVFQRMFDALRPQGVLVTYCAKGEVKRRLQRAGFAVEALPGPPPKREMTRAVVLK